MATVYSVGRNQIFCGNGADEIISLIYQTFLGSEDIVLLSYPTYSLYETISLIHGRAYKKLVESTLNFQINLDDFLDFPSKATFIVNPNAPTGILLSKDKLEAFLKQYQGLLVVDETYIDFSGGAETVYRLVNKYDNLLVIRTFSKAFSLCGIRVGYAFGCPELIAALDKVKDSYNISYLSQVAAVAALEDYDYMVANAKRIARDRDWFSAQLPELGFTVLPSAANFVFASHERLKAAKIYQDLFDRKILVRFFNDRRVDDWLRISIGTREQMETLVAALKDIVSK